ncbi:MAG TPA: ABC transporter permease, partial [Vicinamibacterales bacterium]|nr:ABC transporter permease [Vicinamibacterales bacterium]
MRLLTVLRLRLRSLVFRGRVDRELDEELRYHLDREIEAAIAAGESPAAARRRLAGVQQRREECVDARRVQIVENLVQDARFSLRQLARSPVFALTALLMIALGTGASVAIFGFVDAALIKPLPYPDPGRLVYVTENTPQIPRASLSYLDYVDWKKQNTVFASLEVHNGRGMMLRTGSGTVLVSGARVSDGFFRTLGVAPALGRDFNAGEDRPGAPATVILTHAAWQKRFGGRADIIGQSITLNTVPHVIVGVLPPSFQFAPRGSPELWTPLQPSGGCETRRSCHNLTGVARLKNGVTIEAARAEMDAIAARLQAQYPGSNRDQGAVVLPLSDIIVGDLRPVLFLLLGGAALLLLIAFVNVTNLLLVRSESRTRELAVRSALGAAGGRLLRQFVAEALLLAVIGGGLGLVAASWGMQVLRDLIPPDMMARMPFLAALGLNGRVVAFALALSAVATFVFSAAPAFRVAHVDVRAGMGEGSRGASGTTWHRLGFTLVVVEIATAMVLLSGAGLLGKSLNRLLGVDLGFMPERLATLQIAAPSSTYGADEKAVALSHDILDRVRRLPGVESAALTSVLPVSFNGNTDWIRFVGRPYNGEHNEVNLRDVSGDYFATLAATIVRGRDFTAADTRTSPRVVVINQALARQYFPGQDAIGARIGDTSLTPSSIKEIVGIVEDIREGTLASDIWPAVYYPMDQNPDSSYAIVVRTPLA